MFRPKCGDFKSRNGSSTHTNIRYSFTQEEELENYIYVNSAIGHLEVPNRKRTRGYVGYM